MLCALLKLKTSLMYKDIGSLFSGGALMGLGLF
jgi:hypothetical protein